MSSVTYAELRRDIKFGEETNIVVKRSKGIVPPGRLTKNNSIASVPFCVGDSGKVWTFKKLIPSSCALERI